MTKQEYKEREAQINEDAKAKIAELRKEFVKTNNPYNLGDIISDHYKTIRIQGVKSISVICGDISWSYYGEVLKKDGTPAKNQKDNIVYFGNIVKQ